MRALAVLVVLSVAASMNLAAGTQSFGDPERRIKLLDAVEVASETISLSDLIPASASPELHSRASQISLGNSPLLGNSRTLERAVIEHHLQRLPESDVLQVPERIKVTRSGHLLSVQEVWLAIFSNLEQGDRSGAELFRAGDLTLSAPVFVGENDPGLIVQRIECDPNEQWIRFRMAVSNPKKALPFYITVHDPSELMLSLVRRKELPRHSIEKLIASDTGPENPAGSRERRQSHTLEIDESSVQGSIDVKPGNVAKMLVEGPGFRIVSQVMPLQAGTVGQQIRVRTLDSRRVLTAEVVGRDYLRQTISQEARK